MFREPIRFADRDECSRQAQKGQTIMDVLKLVRPALATSGASDGGCLACSETQELVNGVFADRFMYISLHTKTPGRATRNLIQPKVRPL